MYPVLWKWNHGLLSRMSWYTPKIVRTKNRQQNVCIRFHVPAVRRPTLVRREGNLGSGYKNTDLKWSRKLNRAFTRSHRSSSSAESNRSALTDHAVQENHVISWSAASVIDRESDLSTRWIKEAVHIRKERPQSMNRDEGSYQLSHAYDRFLGSTLTCRAKNRKKKT